MITLGIYNLGTDPSAAIIKDGHVIAYNEEERLLRYKHADGLFPSRAIEQVLKQCNLSIGEIDNIAIPWDCSKYDDGRIEQHYEEINAKYNITHPNDIAYEKKKINQFKSSAFEKNVQKKLKQQFGNVKLHDIHFVNHHFSHACTAFLTSGIDKSLILTIDGSGEEITVAIWEGNGNKINLLKEVKTPISLGWFYSAFTEYIGFHAYGDEWQVMGMASYGSKTEDYLHAKEKFAEIIWYDGNGGIEGNPHLISLGEKSFSDFCSDSFASHLGKPHRTSSDELEQWHKDYALAAQNHLEEIIFDLVKFWVTKTDINSLCLAGGVAMNVKMNGNLFESDFLDKVYVYPVAADAGTSIGAGMALQYNLNQLPENQSISNVYLGNSYSDSEIEEIIQKCKLSYTKPINLESEIAKYLESGNIIGWFQSGMEAGQRALGARSILADPRKTELRDKVNSVIKYRQPWRPFCPSMLEESVHKYFVQSAKIKACLDFPIFDFMTLTLTANDLAKKEVPAIVHEDKTSRIQLVRPNANPRYYNLIKEFQKLTNVGVLLNTSFNIKGEPIVCSPTDAIRTFFATGLDILVLGNCVIKK